MIRVDAAIALIANPRRRPRTAAAGRAARVLQTGGGR